MNPVLSSDAEARTIARTAAALVRLHLAESAIDATAQRLDRVAHVSDVRVAIAAVLSLHDVDILRLEAAAAAGIADACKTSIAPRLIAHEEYAWQKHADLTAAADGVRDLLEYAASFGVHA